MAACYQIYLNAGGTAPTADDLDKLGRMKAYVVRHWQRQQHAHAYTAGGVALSQCLMPFLADRDQRHFMENSRFYYTLTRDHAGNIQYVPGRGNNGGDSYLDFNSVKYYFGGLFQAMGTGNLPSFPAPSATRAFVRMNSPLNDWPQLAARRAKVMGLSQALNLDVTNNTGSVLTSGYTATWSQVSGSTVGFSTTTSEDTTVTFPAAGAYRLRLTAVVGACTVAEDYDFEVATSVTPPVANSITTQPVSRVGVPGGNATFSVATAGDGPFLYEWKLNGTAYWGSSANPALAITNLATGHAGNYTCTIHTPTGTLTSSAATLSIPTTTNLTNGGLKREVWNGLSGGTVANLTGNARYPLFPDMTSVATTIETPSAFGESYGERYTGWLVPPTTGQYKFFVASDDASEVWLSTTDSAANKVKICQITGYTGYRSYSTGGISALITLTAGQRYYIEVLHKEGGGGDHLALAWQLPGGSAPANGSEPIGSANLQYEAIAPDASLNGLASWWKMDEGTGTLAADVLSTANDGTLNAPVWATGKRGGALTFDGNDRVTCSNLGALNGTTAFTVAAWVKVNAGANADAVVLQQRAANGFNGQYQLKVTAAGKAGFYVYGNSAEQFNFAGATSINDGNWHHIAGVRDDLGNAYIYLDGVQDGSVTGTTVRSLSSSINIGIGCDIRDSNKYFRGSIDDVRVYNRLLSAAEIANIRNQAPVFTANPITGSNATEDAAYSGSISATDPETETITFSKVSGPAWLVVAANGTLSGTPSNSDVGANSFTVRASDTSGGVTDATLEISVINSNDAPVFTADPISAAATEDAALSDQLAATDADAGDSLTYSKVSGPAWLLVSSSGAVSGTSGNGDVGLNNFVVRVTDGSGAFDEAALNVTVANVNDSPAFTADPIEVNATEDSALTGQLPAADIDSGDILTFTKISGPSWLAVSSSGALSGTPSNAEVGANHFVVRVTDTAGSSDDATLTVSVANVNDAPAFAADPMTRPDGTAGMAYTGQTLAGSASDADAGDTLTYSKVSGPAWLNVASDGSLSGTPSAAGTGANSFIVRVTDADGASDDATLNITVNNSLLAWWTFNEGTGTNAADASGNSRDATLQGATWAMPRVGHAAIATNGTASQYAQAPSLDTTGGVTIAAWIKPASLSGHRALVSENNSYVFKTNGSGLLLTTPGILDHYSTGVNLTVNEWTHVAVTFQPGTTGGVKFYVNGVLASTGNASGLNQSTEPTILGNATNWTGQEYNGSLDDVRIYGGPLPGSMIADIYNNYPAPPTPVAPSFASDPVTGSGATEDAAYSATLAGSATDPDVGDTLSYSKVSGPSWLAVAANGTLSGTPGNSDSGANGFTVRVTDSTGLTDDATLQINVANVNDAPVFAADPFNLNATEDAAFTGQLAASDIDADETLTFTKVSGPAWLAVSTSGALTGTPANGDVGTNSFIVRVTDGSGAFDDAVLEIAVANVNDAPAFTADPINTNATEDTALTGQLAATDADAGDSLTFTKVSGPAWLSVSTTGALSGTPSNGNVGANNFVVRVTDGSAAFDEAALNITVANVNDTPAFTIDPIVAAGATEGVAYTGQTIGGSATDPDAGDTITYSKVSGPAWLAVASNGTLSGTPATGSSGLNSFVVRATDGSGATDDAQLQITVAGLPLPWTSGDIGTGMLAGSATYNTGTFTQAGSGALGGTTDRLRFTYQTLTGDGEIIARISSLQNTGTSSRVGVMIRDTLATNSRQVFIGLTGTNAYRWVRRTTTGGSNSTSNNSTGTVPNTWVRLARVGNTITAYKSTNGTSWTSVGSTTVTMATNCYIGLTDSSGSTTTLNTSQFSSVVVTP